VRNVALKYPYNHATGVTVKKAVQGVDDWRFAENNREKIRKGNFSC
jgi:hypothetical protein